MKIKENFVLQQIADEFVVVPIGAEADRLHGLFNLNETGAFLWRLLSQEAHIVNEDELVKHLVDSFSVDTVTAQKDVIGFIQKLGGFGCLEN